MVIYIHTVVTVQCDVFFVLFVFFWGFFRGLYIKHIGLRGQFSKVPSRYTQRFAIDNRRRSFGLGLPVSL